jgi:hypothetical protein
MTQADHFPDHPIEAIYHCAALQVRDGVAPAAIEKNLTDQGVRPEVASSVVDTLLRAQAKVNREAGQKNMLYGALWCAGGIIVTTLTYEAASSGGGRYVVAWGAILFGAIQFLSGLVQAARS